MASVPATLLERTSVAAIAMLETGILNDFNFFGIFARSPQVSRTFFSKIRALPDVDRLKGWVRVEWKHLQLVDCGVFSGSRLASAAYPDIGSSRTCS